MLAAASLFLGARRLRAEGAARVRPLTGVSAAKETSFNLAIAGATFFLGGLTAGWGLRWILTPDMLGFWILAGVAILGAIAFLAGVLGYIIALMLGGDARRDS